jgi:tetratricopeptide (TPR) repeat protein
MVTGVDDKSEFMKTVRAEVDYYIIKPPNIETLSELIKKVIISIKSPSKYQKAISNGKFCLLNDELDKSIQSFEIAEKEQPDAAQPLYYKALIYDKKGDIKKAELHYKKALIVESNYINALTGLAKIYQKKRQYPKLLYCLNRASEIAPASFDISLNLAIACHETGAIPEAKANFKEAAKFAKKNKDKIKKLLEAYISAGFIDEADDLFGRKLQDYDDDAKTVFFWNRLALKCISLRRYDKARYLFLSALKLDPQNRKVNFNLAKLLYQQKDYESAKAYLQKVVRLYPDFEKATILMRELKKVS